MAFPSVRSAIKTDGTGTSATPVVSLPATVGGGDTLFVIFKSAAAGAIGWPDASWQELVDASPDGSVGQIGIAWKKALGNEGGTTITLSSANARFAACVYAIQDAHHPEVRAPESSTVAIGTAAGEPNATTCTPTGGAKDYLWLTTYIMEGEQTGVVTYPTNYTGSQLWANSGTTGAVTSNCTIGAAVRTANAASEDAGIWDVNGTLDDWSAYTFAFHPAEAVPAPLQTEQYWPAPLPRKWPNVGMVAASALALLTWEPPPEPILGSVTSWSTSRIVTARPAALIPTWSGAFAEEETPPPPDEPPVFGNATALPERSRLILLPTWTGAPLEDEVVEAEPPFTPRDWPLPARLETWRAPQTISRGAEGEVEEEVFDPVTPIAWPLPPARAVVPPQTWTHAQRLEEGEPPFTPRAWPLPLRSVAPTQTWTQARRLDVVVEEEPPFTPRAWPLPPARAVRLSRLGHIFYYVYEVLDDPSILGYAQPLPLARRAVPVAFVSGTPQVLTTVVVVDDPVFGRLMALPDYTRLVMTIEGSPGTPEAPPAAPAGAKPWLYRSHTITLGAGFQRSAL